LSPAEFVRVAVHVIRKQADTLKPFSDQIGGLLPTILALDLQTLSNDLTYGHPWVERGVWVLEDHLHFTGVSVKICTGVSLRKLLAFKPDLTLGFVPEHPTIVLPSVVFPEPPSPTRPTFSFPLIARLISSTAWTTFVSLAPFSSINPHCE